MNRSYSLKYTDQLNKLILYITTVLLMNQVRGQENLVPNGSFEEYYTCPDDISQISHIPGWSSIKSTSDYYNVCNNTSAIQMELVGVPKNFTGYQYPVNGDAYCGLFSFGDENVRELIGCELNTPLEPGVTYYVSLKFNFPYIEGDPCHNTAIKNMGVRFTDVQYSVSSPPPLDNICHVCADEFIYDTLNWTQVKGSFTPSQSYRFLLIGNFFTDANTDTMRLFPPLACGNCSYYYVDAVQVSTDSSIYNQDIFESIKIPNIFTPNSDGINDVWVFTSAPKAQLEIINRWGNLIYKANGNFFSWNGEGCTDGVYFYRIITNEKVKSGYIELIR